MSLRYGVIVFGDLTQAQHQIGDTKLLIFFHTTQKKSTSLRVVEISKIRSYRLYFFFISQIGKGEKKAAWERGGFQAVAYLD